jgi:hypothetical protein
MTRRTAQWGYALAAILILFMGFQLVLYRQYAFEATWIYAREAVGLATYTDQYKHGAICNSLANVRCSVRIFRKLVKDHPADTNVLSNFAMSLAMAKNAEEAVPYFKAYFAAGGQGFDVMFWYGKVLKTLGAGEESIPWFYNVLYYQSENKDAALELLSTLENQDRFNEAQSLRVSLLNETQDEKLKTFWKLEILQHQQQKRAVANITKDSVKKDSREMRQYQFPAIDGRRFFLPVMGKNEHASFMKVVAGEINSILSVKDMREMGLTFHTVSENKIRVQGLKIANLSVGEFEAQACESCESQIGENLLTQFHAHVDGRGKVPYLVISEGEE